MTFFILTPACCLSSGEVYDSAPDSILSGVLVRKSQKKSRSGDRDFFAAELALRKD